jgi:hypothetical protein
MDNDELDDSVNDLISQLQSIDNNTGVQKSQKELTPEDVEKFLVMSSGKLVTDSLDVVSTLKEYVRSSPNPEDVEALARILSSSAAAIETLNKIHINERKITAQRQIKEMDIESKKEIEEQRSNAGALTINRDELLDYMISKAKVIDADATDAEVAEIKDAT